MDAFRPDAEGLAVALEHLLSTTHRGSPTPALPSQIPAVGIGPVATLSMLRSPVLDGARDLGAPGFFAHMDPPTPWITWAVHQWSASRNQNLLHPDTAPEARELESLVVRWLSPLFGMDGGHLTPGSSIANLTALWAAREGGATEVVATSNSHLSISKAAHILGLAYREVTWNDPGDLSAAAAVVTAGATSTGEIEPLDAGLSARWRHVDAAWSGPLRLSERHCNLLDGIENADSVAVSAHKWLFQPKESALALFADTASAHRSISMHGEYLTVPNVGVLGSHGASAAPLIATLLAYGQRGIAEWIDHSMELADDLYALIQGSENLEARTPPNAGVVNWRRTDLSVADTISGLPADVFVSSTTIDGEPWLRSVAANPMADPQLIVETIRAI